jgi:TRAP transporter TAXI family solute receptor
METQEKSGSLFWQKLFLFGSLICFLILLVSSPAFPQKKRISIGGAQAGGTSYPVSVGMAEIINRFLPDYNAIALETGGTVENFRLLDKGEIEIGIGNFRDGNLALNAIAPYNTPLKNLRLGPYIFTAVLHVVALEKSNIKTIQDLKGKTVNLGAAGSNVAQHVELLLKLHNISIKDIKARHLGASESMEAVSDGLFDAACLFSAIPSSAVNSLAVRNKIRLVSADEKILTASESVEKIACSFIPPQTYKGQNEGAFGLGSVTFAYFHDKTSTDDVYKWTKAFTEHKEVIEKIHPIGKELRLPTKKESEYSTHPLHPGVVKYAKEVGVNY